MSDELKFKIRWTSKYKQLNVLNKPDQQYE